MNKLPTAERILTVILPSPRFVVLSQINLINLIVN